MILIVDDDKRLRNTLAMWLSHAGYDDVALAGDGLEAYELARDPACEVVLLDMTMPRVNGAELLMLMQADGTDVPVLVITAFDDFQTEELTLFANVRAVLHKPFDHDDLVQALNDHVNPRSHDHVTA